MEVDDAYDPASGSTFGIDTTTVDCSASDSLGNEATGSFSVTVADTSPALVLPDDMTVEATSAAGAPVAYTATATDAAEGSLLRQHDHRVVHGHRDRHRPGAGPARRPDRGGHRRRRCDGGLPRDRG